MCCMAVNASNTNQVLIIDHNKESRDLSAQCASVALSNLEMTDVPVLKLANSDQARLYLNTLSQPANLVVLGEDRMSHDSGYDYRGTNAANPTTRSDFTLVDIGKALSDWQKKNSGNKFFLAGFASAFASDSINKLHESPLNMTPTKYEFAQSKSVRNSWLPNNFVISKYHNHKETTPEAKTKMFMSILSHADNLFRAAV